MSRQETILLRLMDCKYFRLNTLNNNYLPHWHSKNFPLTGFKFQQKKKDYNSQIDVIRCSRNVENKNILYVKSFRIEGGKKDVIINKITIDRDISNYPVIPFSSVLKKKFQPIFYGEYWNNPFKHKIRLWHGLIDVVDHGITDKQLNKMNKLFPKQTSEYSLINILNVEYSIFHDSKENLSVVCNYRGLD